MPTTWLMVERGPDGARTPYTARLESLYHQARLTTDDLGPPYGTEQESISNG